MERRTALRHTGSRTSQQRSHRNPRAPGQGGGGDRRRPGWRGSVERIACAAHVELLEMRRLLANVAFFNNTTYLDTDENTNLISSLQAAGHTVNTFTGITATDFNTAL